VNFPALFLPLKLCDIARIQCAACPGFGVRHRPDLLCGMLRIMHFFLFWEQEQWGIKNRGIFRIELPSQTFHNICEIYHFEGVKRIILTMVLSGDPFEKELCY